MKDFPKETLIQLLKINEDITSIDEGIRGDFFKTKFNYAELIFNYLIRRYNIQNNNIWNIRTLVNMNLYGYPTDGLDLSTQMIVQQRLPKN